MINQTRTLLVVALLFVGYLLWQQWQHDYPPAPPPAAAATSAPTASAAVPSATPVAPPASAPGVPAVPGVAPATAAAPQTPAQDLIVVSNDVLRLKIDPAGGTIVAADLLAYPEKVGHDRTPVRLLDRSPNLFYVAQSGLVAATGSVAPAAAAVYTAGASHYALQAGAKDVTATLAWHAASSGIEVVKRYTLARGSYVVQVSQELVNQGAKPWQGNAYEQLDRVEPPAPPKHFLEFYNPDSLAYTGAAWYSPSEKFKKLKFGDFKTDPNQDPLKGTEVAGGWIAMSQRFFVGAFIADPKVPQSFSSVELPGTGANAKPRYLIRMLGPSLTVAPGTRTQVDTRLYIGPKLQNHLASIAPGLNYTVDYGMWTVIAAPMFKLLSGLHALVRNWGLAIIALVLIIQGLTWKLTEAQYRSGARMRKLQPRLKALKERFGNDKQKYQQAMMELYKKEKVNPMSGCLPTLVVLPIFFALYYVLIYSVELRHAAFLWVPDLSAADPYFILPVLYTLTMVGTSYLTPAQGMDPTQAKLMKVMPLLFSVIFYFFPSGLTLYYVVRGICMVSQQWYVTRQVERAEARARA